MNNEPMEILHLFWQLPVALIIVIFSLYCAGNFFFFITDVMEKREQNKRIQNMTEIDNIKENENEMVYISQNIEMYHNEIKENLLKFNENYDIAMQMVEDEELSDPDDYPPLQERDKVIENLRKEVKRGIEKYNKLKQEVKELKEKHGLNTKS